MTSMRDPCPRRWLLASVFTRPELVRQPSHSLSQHHWDGCLTRGGSWAVSEGARAWQRQVQLPGGNVRLGPPTSLVSGGRPPECPPTTLKLWISRLFTTI